MSPRNADHLNNTLRHHIGLRIAAVAGMLGLGIVVLPAPAAAAGGDSLLRYAAPLAADVAQDGEMGVVPEMDADRLPLALAVSDFDEDGVADLAVSWRGPGGEAGVNLWLGNAGRQAPFFAAGPGWSEWRGADFLAAGDFDRDGHVDLALAPRDGWEVELLYGNGRGGFDRRELLELPGRPTALAAGAIDRWQGYEDLAVAVDGPLGPSLVLFAGEPVARSAAAGAAADGPGVATATPLMLPLEAPAAALAFGNVVGGFGRDLVVGAGAELLVLEGRDGFAAATGERSLHRIAAAGEVVALTLADLSGGGENRLEVAYATTAGDVFVVSDPAAAPKRASAHATLGSLSGSPQRPWLVPVRQAASGGDGLLLPAPGAVEVLAWEDDAAGEPELFARQAISLAGAPIAALALRLDGDALSDLVVLREGSAAPEVVPAAPAAVFTVNSTGDESDLSAGNGVCLTSVGTCTLRAAIQEANALTGADTIQFAINPGGGGVLRVIAPQAPLPIITGPTTIQGPNSDGLPLFINGAGSIVTGLRFNANNGTIRNLAVNNFSTKGIELMFGAGHVVAGVRVSGNVDGILVGAAAATIGGTQAADLNTITGNTASGIHVQHVAFPGVVIQGNVIGLLSGQPAGNDTGIRLERGALVGGTAAGAGNTISENIDGISLSSADGAEIVGNKIGTTTSGQAARGNETGISSVDGADILVGGATPAARNLLAASASNGLLGSQSGLAIRGNYVGLDADGDTALPNGTNGLRLSFAADTVVDGNVISGNNGNGLDLRIQVVDSVTVTRNTFGTSADGLTAVPNGGHGISSGAPGSCTIGGEGGAGNRIAGNGQYGIWVGEASMFMVGSCDVFGNTIGIAADGAPLGNASGGIRAVNGSSSIGGPGGGNVIAYNGGPGVDVFGPTAIIPILNNSMYSNAGLAIDLNSDGVTANDPGDIDAGPNDLLNYPILTLATVDAGTTTVDGVFDGAPGTYLVQIFHSAACDPSGHGEAEVFVQETSVAASPTGQAAFSIVSTGIPPGAFVTATATNTLGNTSELSACLEVETNLIFADGFESGNTGAWQP